MRKDLQKSRKFIFFGIIIISLGITLSTSMKDTFGTIGTVFIAVGGLFFIIGMSNKTKEDNQKNISKD